MNAISTETIILMTSIFVFCCGIAGVALRKNPVAVLMSIELMINAAMMALILGSRVHHNVQGQSVALLVLVLGAAEAVVGLAIALAIFRSRDVVDVDVPQEIKG